MKIHLFIYDGTTEVPRDVTKVIVKDGVTSIGKWEFSNCKSLTSITIPNSVTSIGHRAFAGCKSLKSITIPDGVKSIRNYTFENCKSLETVNLLNPNTKIPKSAFKGCTSLKSSSIPGRDDTSTKAISTRDVSGLAKEILILFNNLKPISSEEWFNYFLENLDDGVEFEDLDSIDYDDEIYGSLRKAKDIHGTGDIYYFSCDDEDGFYNGDMDYSDVFEPLQYGKFYGGTEEVIDSGDQGGDVITVISAPGIGEFIQRGGGYSEITMNSSVRKNIMKYVKKNANKINKTKI